MNLRIFAILGLLVVSCGRDPGTKIPPVSGETVTLAVFGAEWCGECKADLPLLQGSLKARLGEAFSRVKMELWVPTGKTPSTPPSAEGAESYRQLVGLEGKSFIDGSPTQKPPRWPKFVELFPSVQRALPAAVLYRADGTVYKKFAPGADSFHPADIVATVAEALPK